MVEIIGAEKNGCKIILTTNTNYKYTFNFDDFTITSARGQLKHTPLKGCIFKRYTMSDGEKLLVDLCSNPDFLTLDNDCAFVRHYHSIETFLSALDICPDNMHRLPTENPKGYIKWLREEGEKASRSSLKMFKELEKTKNMPEHIKQKLNAIKNLNILSKELALSLFDSNEKISFIYSAIKNTFKNFEDITSLKEQIIYLSGYYEKYSDKVDSNRSVAYNKELILILETESQYPCVATNQEKFKALEEIEHNEWEIIVPTSVGQLIDEGRQQNNCVGRLYPSHINNGDILVYFIRKKNSPDKSWHTCSAYVHPNNYPNHIYSDQVLIANNRSGVAEVVDWVKNVVDEKIKEIVSNLR